MDWVASERRPEGFADAELLAGMRAGNSAAFAALMRSNNQRLYRLARGFLRDDLEAEEAVHDGYVSAFTHLDGFRGGSSLATWLGSNEALVRLRRRRSTLDIGERSEILAARYPKGPQRCQICLQFAPPDKCKIVQGQVFPQGWCHFFSRQERMLGDLRPRAGAASGAIP